MAVSVVIPALNEEHTIAEIVRTAKTVELVDEIIVVSDGSIDNTPSIAVSCGAKVIVFPENRGKGAAIKAGVENCSGDIILLMDADLIGIKPHHIKNLLMPVIKNDADMTIGVFRHGRLATDLAHRISPYLSGQRALKREILNEINSIAAAGYGIEIALTRYVEKNNIRVSKVELEELTHMTKEQKYGLVRGFGKRMKMYWQIYKGAKLAKQ